MLAQNFLSAPDLGILPVERDALVTVLGMLERGELQNDPVPMRPSFKNGFHMGPMIVRSGENVCACIAGWANIVSDGRAFTDEYRILELVVAKNDGFVQLGTSNMRNATVEQAATALRNYLTTGWPRWDEVFASEQSGLGLLAGPRSASPMMRVRFPQSAPIKETAMKVFDTA